MSDDATTDGEFPATCPLPDGSALRRCTECGCVQFDPTDHYLRCSQVSGEGG